MLMMKIPSNGRGRSRKKLISGLLTVESEEDKKFKKYMKRQERLAKKYSKFQSKESIDPNLENFIYMEAGDER
jgi:hypothetical protein